MSGIWWSSSACWMLILPGVVEFCIFHSSFNEWKIRQSTAGRLSGLYHAIMENIILSTDATLLLLHWVWVVNLPPLNHGPANWTTSDWTNGIHKLRKTSLKPSTDTAHRGVTKSKIWCGIIQSDVLIRFYPEYYFLDNSIKLIRSKHCLNILPNWKCII